MSNPQPEQVIARILGPYLVTGRTYPRPLPEELAPWYCYPGDSGHSIVVSLASFGAPTDDNLVPAPVKAVLRTGWTIVDGYVVCDLPYDPELGLITEADDDEYGDDPAAEEPAPTLHAFAVGKPHNPKISPAQWMASDGMGQLRLTPRGVEFVLPVSDPRPHEVKAFGRGNAEFAIVQADRFLMLLYRFTDPHDSDPKHGLPWADAVWQYHRQAQIDTVAVPGLPGSPVALQLALVNARTGTTEALRLITTPSEFADELRNAVTRQQAVPCDPAQAMREIQALYSRHSSADLLLQAEARFEALRDGSGR